MKDFKDKVVVITGAGSGIGRAIALEFAREGAKLHLSDIRGERVEAVAAEAKALGAEARTYVTDVSKPDSVQKLSDDVFAAAGRVDVLVNNAGIGTSCPIQDIPLADWEKILSINLWGVIYGVHFFLPRMIAQGGGHILNTASGFGLFAVSGVAPYATTKFAVVGMSEVMHVELAKHNVWVSALCPGVINTNIVKDGHSQLKGDPKREMQQKREGMFQDHGASPEVVARAALKGVRKRQAVIVAPRLHVYPVWFSKRLSYRLYFFFARMFANRVEI